MAAQVDMSGVYRRESTCGRSQCCKETEGFSCRGCGEVHYCSEECQQQHWACGHKTECSKLQELQKLLSRAAEKNNTELSERMTDAYLIALGKYLPKRLETLQGDPANFETFFDFFQPMTMMIDLVTSRSKFEEHFRIMFQVLDDAECLRQEGKLLYYDCDSDVSAKNKIQHLNAFLCAKKGEVLLREIGDSTASDEMFERAASIANEIELENADEAWFTRVVIETTRGRMHYAINDLNGAISIYENAYVLMQDKCSPDDRLLQDITNKLVELHRKVGDNEKADRYAQVVVENLEHYYEGKPRIEVGMALRNLAEGLFLRAESETDGEKKKDLLDEYELHMRRAITQFKGHDDPDPNIPAVSNEFSFEHYCRALGVLVAFVNRYGRYEANDLQELFNENIECCRKVHFRVATASPSLATLQPSAAEHKKITLSYVYAFCYYDHRERLGSALTKEESALLARRKSEYQTMMGMSKNEFSKWYKALPEARKRMEKLTGGSF